MKTLALAGLMTLSAIAGSAITLSLSQASFAQESQKDDDDGHWTQQHPAGTTHAQQQTAKLQTIANKVRYTEYATVSGDKNLGELKTAVENAMIEGWQPQGGLVISCGSWDCNYFQAMAR